MDQAACAGRTDLFFSPHVCWETCPPDCQAGRSETGRFSRIKAARKICAECDVLEECREWALETRFSFGLIAGLSERQRKQILKERDAQTRATSGCSVA